MCVNAGPQPRLGALGAQGMRPETG
jgi:hypothetical protein